MQRSPRVAWEYSNANYQILGRLIEVVSGQAYPAYIEREILEPAGMLHSFVSDGDVHPEMATGHRPWVGSKRPMRDHRIERRVVVLVDERAEAAVAARGGSVRLGSG